MPSRIFENLGERSSRVLRRSNVAMISVKFTVTACSSSSARPVLKASVTRCVDLAVVALRLFGPPRREVFRDVPGGRIDVDLDAALVERRQEIALPARGQGYGEHRRARAASIRSGRCPGSGRISNTEPADSLEEPQQRSRLVRVPANETGVRPAASRKGPASASARPATRRESRRCRRFPAARRAGLPCRPGRRPE